MIYVLTGYYTNDEGIREETYLGCYSSRELAERARDAFHFLSEEGENRATVIRSGYELDSGWYEEFWDDWEWTWVGE